MQSKTELSEKINTHYAISNRHINLIIYHRFVLTGAEKLRVEIPAKRLVTMNGADMYKIVWEVDVKDITFKLNTFTSDWLDLEDR